MNGVAEAYLDLVVRTVVGRSPIPEHRGSGPQFLERAQAHLDDLSGRSLPSDVEEHPLFQAVLASGPEFLANMWERVSPAALTMCGAETVGHLVDTLMLIEREGIAGDFIETGVWRGGLPIVMRAFLRAAGNTERTVWVADSFQGLPDAGMDLRDQIAHLLLEPVVHLEARRKDVEAAFEHFGLLDSQVELVEGWFADTLPKLDPSPLALIRLDGDYYESTRDALIALYPRLTSGGFILIDDYNLPLGCRDAVDEYRAMVGSDEPLEEINAQAVFWRKGTGPN